MQVQVQLCRYRYSCAGTALVHVTWYRGTKGNNADGSNGIFESNATADVRRNVAEDGRHEADADDTDNEGGEPARQLCPLRARYG